MFKKCKVVMLPTSEKANITYWELPKKLNFNIIPYNNTQNLNKNQHLYIISDKKIKDGDWFLTDIRAKKSDNNGEPIWELKRCLKTKNEWIFDTTNDGLGYNPDWCKKIIATTDTRLKISKFSHFSQDLMKVSVYKDYLFSQPSQQFIKKYIEEYNKSNIITEVLVEFEQYHGINTSIAEINYISGDGNLNWKGANDLRDFKLKINPQDNTITIKKIKGSWNRKEVIELIQKYNSDFKVFQDNEKWIEENL